MVVKAVDYGLGVNIVWNWCGYERVEGGFEPHVALQEGTVAKKDFRTPEARRGISIYANVGFGELWVVLFQNLLPRALQWRIKFHDSPRSAAHVRHPEPLQTHDRTLLVRKNWHDLGRRFCFSVYSYDGRSEPRLTYERQPEIAACRS